MPIFAVGRIPRRTVQVSEQFENNILIRSLTLNNNNGPELRPHLPVEKR